MPAESVFSFERFIHELVLAWKKLSAYPPGHPLRQGAIDGPYRELKGLLAAGDPLVIGVSAHGLSWGEERLSTIGSQQLAKVLYERNVALLRFHPGVRRDELESTLLNLKPQTQTQEIVPVSELLTDPESGGIEMESADYSSVVATDRLDPRMWREPTSLWERILGWQMEGKPPIAGFQDGDLSQVLDFIASSLGGPGRHAGGGSGTSEEVRELVARLSAAVRAHLADESPGIEQRLQVKQVAKLIQALPQSLRGPVLDAALEHLVETEADGESLGEVIASTSAIEAVQALRRLRDSGKELSPAAVRLVDELALSAEGEARRVGGGASPAELQKAIEESLTGDVVSLPEELFLEVPVAPPGEPVGGFDEELKTLAPRATLQRLIQTLFHFLATDYPDERIEGAILRLSGAFETLLAVGHAAAASALLLRLRDLAGSSGLVAQRAQRVLERLSGASTVPVLVAALQQTSQAERGHLTRIVELLDEGFFGQLLMALSEVEDRAERRAIFDFLRSQPARVLRDAPKLLGDPRWFVARNSIGLLHAIGDRRAGPAVRACLSHADARVRFEALKALAALDPTLPPQLAIERFADPDERVARRAVKLAGELRMRAAVEPLLEILKPRDFGGQQRELRIQALKSLGWVGDPRALTALKRFFSGLSPMISIEERRAAFGSLGGYPPEAVQGLVAKGIKHRDPEIHAACQRIAAGRGGQRG